MSASSHARISQKRVPGYTTDPVYGTHLAAAGRRRVMAGSARLSLLILSAVMFTGARTAATGTLLSYSGSSLFLTASRVPFAELHKIKLSGRLGAIGASGCLPGACGSWCELVFFLITCLTCGPGTSRSFMVRRRSTVRFRKGAPDKGAFSNLELYALPSGKCH